LGEQYVSLDGGGSDEYLKNGSKIEITNSALVLEKALGQFLFKSAEEKKATPSPTKDKKGKK
jgi:phospholipid/cholesterol/gamma-HCH transport system substrate-binding protein